MSIKRILTRCFSILLVSISAHALDPNGFEQFMHVGHVYARTVVTTESGEPMWAEYNEQGGHTHIHSLDGERGTVFSATQIRTYIDLFEDLKGRYNGDVEVLDAQSFSTSSILTADGREITNWPVLPSDAITVVIPTQTHRFNATGSSIEHYAFPIDIRSFSSLGADVETVLIDSLGQSLYESDERLGLLTAFYIEAGSKGPADATEYENASSLTRLIDDDYEVLSPIGGVYIDANTGYRPVATSSEDDGQYVLKGPVVPCPGFGYQPVVDAYATLYYANFSPRGNPVIPYYLKHTGYHICNGWAAFPGAYIGQLLAYEMVAGQPDNVATLNYAVGINVLGGLVALQGVEVSDTSITEYSAETSPESLYMVADDYDGDGELDSTVRGKLNTEGGFEANAEGDLYGVYFSSNSREDGQPNITRVMDVAPNGSHEGLVSSISKEDLEKTDIFVFRESTGELITQRSGMTPYEIGLVGGTGVGEANSFRYSLAVRSPEDMHSFKASAHDDFIGWQADAKMNPALQSYKADFIRTGETIRVVAINRPTGYIGSATVAITSAAYGGDVTVYVPPIIMSPPNLKVWATRRYQPQGLLKNSDQERNIIANGGAATTDDYVIEVHTEWMDQSGYPLPHGLAGYGYTGRLTKQVDSAGESGSDTFDSNVTEFSIDPGRQMQVLKFGADEPYHHYVQVNGYPSSEENDFSAGDLTGVLRHRPNRYVPVKVPLYDEQGSIDDQIAVANSDDDSLTKADVDARFGWVYRPELSFSMIDLMVSEINEEDLLNPSNTINLLNEKSPVISSTADLVKVIFNLIGSEYERITSLDGEQQYIFALGDQEIEVTLDKGKDGSEEQQISFSNLEYLSELEVEDYLTLSLYLNQDAQNVLWEWGMQKLDIYPPQLDEENVKISADDAVNNTEAIIAFVQGDQVEEAIDHLKWQATNGTLSDAEQNSSDGLFVTELSLSTVAGTLAEVKADLNNQGRFSSTSVTFETTPGEPRFFNSISSNGSISIAGRGTKHFKYRLTDQFGNSVKDGTPISIFADNMTVNNGLAEDASAIVTADGYFEFDLKGDYVAGSHTLRLTSGGAEHEQTVDVADINIAVIAPSNIEVGSTVEVEITASGDVEGLEVSLAAHRGSLVDDRIIIQDGRATTSMYVGEVPGDGYVFVRIGEKVAKQPFVVKSSDGSYLLDDVLVSDAERGEFVANGVTFQYTNATLLRLAGTPGEEISTSINSLTEPLINPLLSYRFNQLPTDGEYVDDQGSINALASGVDVESAPVDVRGGEVAVLGNGDFIATPWSDNFVQNTDIGFATQLQAGVSGQVVEYAGSLKLAVLQDGRIEATVITSAGVESVSSTQVNTADWHNVGVHIRDGKLQLGVDKDKYEVPLTGTLQPQPTGNLLKIGGLASQNLKIATFKLIDWNGVAMLELDSPDGRYTVQADGFANAQVSVPTAYIALNQQRQRDRLYEMYAKQTRFQFIPSAYAGDLSDCASQVSVVDEAGYAITAGWAMLSSLSECVLKRKIEKATIQYETANGTKSETLALVEKALLQSVYAAITLTSDAALVAKDCAGGVLTGDMENATMATCSIVSSFLVIGDVRDLAINGWYWFIDDEENFSAMDATFASLGLVGVALSGTGVGLTVGGPMKTVANVAKVIPKAFKGAKFITPLGSYIAEKVLIKDYEKGAEAFVKVLPFMEVAAFVGFTSFSDEGKPIRDFMTSAIEDSNDLDAWVTYLKKMSVAITDGLITENNLSPSDEARKYLYAFVTEVLMNPAHAGLKEQLASELVENFLGVLNEVRGDLSKYARVTDQPKLARYFTRAIEALNKNVDEGVDNLADLKFTSGPLKVLVSAYGAGGIDAVKGLRNMNGYRKEALNLSFEVTLSYLEKIDYSKFDDADLEALGKVFKKFGGNINESQGAIGEMLTVGAMQKLGKTVSRIQERIPITGPDGTVYAHRVSDMFIDGVFADVKTVTPEGLAKLMQFGTRPGAVIEDSLKKSGQLFRDLIDMGNNPDTRKILVLPPHAKDRVSEVKNAIFNGAGSPGTRNELMKVWGLDPGDPRQIQTFRTKLESLKINFEVVVLDV